MNEAIENMLERYNCTTLADYKNALKEIIQEVALLGLWRAKFFEHAAFYGGTTLRIFWVFVGVRGRSFQDGRVAIAHWPNRWGWIEFWANHYFVHTTNSAKASPQPYAEEDNEVLGDLNYG